MSASDTNAKPPLAQGLYVVARRRDDIIYVSGMTPRKDGVSIQTGQIDLGTPLGEYRDAVRLAAGNAIAAAMTRLRGGEALHEMLSLTVYVSAPVGFGDHSHIADFASEYFRDHLGEAGVGPRAAIGVTSLPSNAPVELQIVVSVKR